MYAVYCISIPYTAYCIYVFFLNLYIKYIVILQTEKYNHDNLS